MSDFTVASRDRAGTAILDLSGDLDGRADIALNLAYAEATASNPRSVLLNFTDVGYVNSTGIALVVGILAQATKAGVEIRVCGLTEHYQHIFEITRLADFMSFFPDEEAAVGEGTATPA